MSVNSVLAGYAFVKITMDDAELKRGLDSAQTKMKAFAAGVNAWASKMTMLAPLIAAPFVMSVKTFAAFDDRMRQVQAVTGATGEAFRQLTEEAKRLGRETSFTAAQVSEGMLALGRMGFNPDQIKSAILPVMNLSRATGTELAQAAEIAANNMRVFNLQAEQMEHVTDILSVTANSSAQTLVDLGEALKMAGPHAKRAGADLTETAAALGILANMGIRGSLAGTALGKSYKQLANPKVIEYLKQYGVETLNADGSMRRMRDTLVDIAKAMKTMTNAEQITFAEEVFDARGSLGGGTLSVNTEGIDQLLEKLKNAEGATAAAAQKMDEGIGGALRRMESAAEGVSIALGEVVSISFLPLVEGASNFLLGIRELIGENGRLLGALVQITATVVGFGAAIKALTFGAGIMKSLVAPLAAMDAMVKGTKAAAAAAVAAERQKELAAAASAAKTAAMEKMKTAAQLTEAAKRTAAAAQEESAKLAAMQAELAANNRNIAAGNTRIAQAQAEAAASGNSAAAVVAAEKAKLAAIQETNVAIQQQIAAQQAVATAATSGAVATQASATKSMQIAQSAAKASEAATAAEAAHAVATKATSGVMIGKTAHIAAMIKAQGTAAVFAKTSSAVIASANLKTLATSIAAANGAKAVTAGFYMQAIGAKVAAGAMTGLRAIMTAIAAHPVTAALIAISALLIVMKKHADAAADALDRIARSAARNVAAASQKKEEGTDQRIASQDDFKRLQQLSEKTKLTEKEMEESRNLIKNLFAYGSGDFSALDETNKRLILFADAHKIYAERMKKQALDLNAALIDAQKKQNDAILRQQVPTDMLDEQSAQYQAGLKKLKKLQEEQKKITDGDMATILNTKKDGSKENYEAEKQKQAAAAEDLAKAEKRIQELDDEAAKRKMSSLEQETTQIVKLREEYMKYIAVLLEAEKAKLAAAQTDMDQNKEGKTQAQKDAYAKAMKQAEDAQKRIRDLEGRQSAANADFDQQTADARKKDEARRQKDPYDNFLGDLDSDRQKRDEQKQLDRDFGSAMEKKDYSAAFTMAEQLFNTQAEAIRQAREQYTAKLEAAKAADSEGGADISETERADLDALKKEISEGSSRMDDYRSRMDEARKAADEAQPEERIAGSWNLAALDAALGNTTAADRTAAATEKSVALQEKTNKKLDDLKDASKSTTTVYGN